MSLLKAQVIKGLGIVTSATCTFLCSTSAVLGLPAAQVTWILDTQTSLVLEVHCTYFSKVTYSNVVPFENNQRAILSLRVEVGPAKHLEVKEIPVFSLEKKHRRWITLSYKMSHCDACHLEGNFHKSLMEPEGGVESNR